MNKNTLLRTVLIGLFAALSSLTCLAQAQEVMPLEGTNWQLVNLTVLGGFNFTPDDPGKYVLNFRSESRLTGSSDCNSLNGSWHQEGSALHFEPFSSTRKLCPPGSLHNNLLLYLRDTNAVKISSGHMVLTTDTDGVEMEFEAR